MNKPGLRQKLEDSGFYLLRKIDENQQESWDYPAEAQPLIDNYPLAEAISHRKREVDALESVKFDKGIIAAYGFIPPAAKMVKWGKKEVEATEWQTWDSAGRVGAEPDTPVIDKEVTANRSRAAMVNKIIINATALENMRGAIELRSQDLKDALSAAVDFDAVAAVDIHAGWPV